MRNLNLDELFAKTLEIDTKKTRLQRKSGTNWSEAQKANAKKYQLSYGSKLKQGLVKVPKRPTASS